VDLAPLIDLCGEEGAAAVGGLVVGLAFGACAQRCRFCLRSAVIELAGGSFGGKVAVWTLAFSAAVASTQAAVLLGWLDPSEARQIAGRGSLSGAIVGGLLFGAGMILSRGCASRLLVLSATGNLRALVSGLILTLVAQASLRGVLSPAREAIAAAWMVEGGTSRSILALLHAGAPAGAIAGATWLTFGAWLALKNRVGVAASASALGVGLAVTAGWVLTYALSQQAFTPIAVKSVSFTGPSADTLMALINSPMLPLGFDLALVPGVFAGSMLAALVAREFMLEGFRDGASMTRYISGAVLMGFGGMLAGGCAVGAGVTGGAIFALTAWVALAAMWVGAALTQTLADRPSGASPRALRALASGRRPTISAALHRSRTS